MGQPKEIKMSILTGDNVFENVKTTLNEWGEVEETAIYEEDGEKKKCNS